MSVFLEPFGYEYMLNAMWVSAMVGGLCAFLSCYLMLKGWSLIGDALSHSIVPGVAGAYMLGLPFSLGAFLSGGLAAGSMLFLNQRSRLVICLVVTPGATAWLLTDRFPRLLMIAVAMGSITSFLGAWASYYLDGATGGIIVVAQTLLFLLAFVFAPKHGLLASRRRARRAQEVHP